MNGDSEMSLQVAGLSCMGHRLRLVGNLREIAKSPDRIVN